MEKTTQDVPDVPMLDRAEKEFWVHHWQAGSFVSDKAAKLTRVLALATQLQVNDIGFDIHISVVVPSISGSLMTSSHGLLFFHDVGELVQLMEFIMSELGEE